MTDKKKNDKPAKAPRRPPLRWGASSAGFFIAVHLLDGHVVRGELVGVDTYDIIVDGGEGRDKLIPKHAIMWVER